MKKFIIILIMLFLMPLSVCSKTADSKNYQITADNLYLVALSSLNKLNFKIAEMQSESGYILFKTPNNDEYLIMISDNGDNTSNIKISKVKQTSPLNEIRQIIFQTIRDNLYDIPIEAVK